MPSFAKSLSLHRDIQPFAEYAVTPFVGVWIETYLTPSDGHTAQVTPFVGVWIETMYDGERCIYGVSHPSWVCGLKPCRCYRISNRKGVTPFVGVWIETLMGVNLFKIFESHPSWVCGLKHRLYTHHRKSPLSHPSWVCGLKHLTQK